MKPFLKWAGNKHKYLPRIKELLPAGHRLIEPFVGAGAVFLGTDYNEYLLADSNPDLIGLFRTLQSSRQEFIDFARSYFVPENNNEEKFYELRDLFNKCNDRKLKSALFIYLNRHCYNGLCRYNKRGEFNTPFGRYTTVYFPEVEMQYFMKKAERAIFECADFEEIMLSTVQGDVIYCDPPYVPLSPTASFTSYSIEGFSQMKQERLARVAELVSHRGIPVLISNHKTEFTMQEYSKAQITDFEVQRFISSKASARGKAQELLALFQN
ncbi:MAG: Dam family site-specific DNA-(adenine-N6)-methyltransferase [Bacteriovoracaceae bacterium]|nr:Dam family site-specific DNA-(adenine-N6)-methyltransferase [Bacteriovoracaceae bacterium]